jgi:hypothetical protein
MRRRAARVRCRQYLCRLGSAHNSVDAARIAAATAVASIGPSWSVKAAIVRCHCDCAGPNAMEDRVVEIEQNRARQFHAFYYSRARRAAGVSVAFCYRQGGSYSAAFWPTANPAESVFSLGSRATVRLSRQLTRNWP